jgi:hypothetical protein
MFTRVEYRIVIGTEYDRDGNPISESDRQAAIQYICHHAARWFGGYTIWESRGGWLDSSGNLVEEAGVVLSILAEDRPDEYASDRCHAIVQHARHYGRKLNQHSVCVIRPFNSAGVIEC